MTIESLRPVPTTIDRQLGRDGALSGDAALQDVLARSDYHRFVQLKRTGVEEAVATRVLVGAYAERLRMIDLMAPPWADTLPPLERAGG